MPKALRHTSLALIALLTLPNLVPLTAMAATKAKSSTIPVITLSNSVTKVNSIIHFQVALRNKNGHTTSLPSSATVTYHITHPTGAFLIPSTQSVMITSPGVYELSATVNGMTSKAVSITANDVVTGVQLSADQPFLTADGKQLDKITATIVDASLQKIANFSGTAMLSPLAHGSYVNPKTGAAISTVAFSKGQATFYVQAGTSGGTNDTIMLSNLTATSRTPMSSVINYGSTSISYIYSTNQPAGVTLSLQSPTLSANGTAIDTVKATVINGYGQPVTTFNGIASLSPIKNGSYVDPKSGQALTSVTFHDGIATFAIKAGTVGGVNDSVSLFGLTQGAFPLTNIAYQTSSINYVWASGQPVGVELSAASPTIVADGEQTDTLTATVVDAYGQPVTSFQGTATLSSLKYGTYNTTGNSLTFVHGVATFTVQAGTIGGVSDQIVLSNLASPGMTLPSNLTYGSTTITYTWLPTNAILLSSATKTVNTTASTEDMITATVPSATSSSFLWSAPIETTFTLTGPASFAQGTSQSTLQAYILPGIPTKLPIYSLPNQTGQITLKAAATGYVTSPLTITAQASGAPSGLSVVTTASTINAQGNAQEPSLSVGTPFTLYNVQLTDQAGNPTVPTNSDPLTVTDNSASVGGTLTYYAVANGQPTGPALSNTELSLSLTQNQPNVQFAVINNTSHTTTPTVSVTDSLGYHATAAGYTSSSGAAEYALFPLQVLNTTSPSTEMMQAGQTATYTLQVTDGADHPVASAGQAVDLYLDTSVKNALTNVTINGSASYTTNNPLVLTTNPAGQVTFTVTTPTVGQFSIDTTLPGSMNTSKQDFTVVAAANYPSQLLLAGSSGGLSANWPTAAMQVGQTLPSYVASINPGITQLYVNLENNTGTFLPSSTQDTLAITTSNPNILAITPDQNWQATNSVDTVVEGAASNALPTITAENSGTATITITDLSNPSQPQILETVTVE